MEKKMILSYKTKIEFGQDKFPTQFFLTQKKCQPKSFDLKKFPTQILLTPKKFRPNFFWPKKIGSELGVNKIWVGNFFKSKEIWFKKIWVKKNCR